MSPIYTVFHTVVTVKIQSYLIWQPLKLIDGIQEAFSVYFTAVNVLQPHYLG